MRWFGLERVPMPGPEDAFPMLLYSELFRRNTPRITLKFLLG